MNISSDFSFSVKHSLRSCHDAILVGINTLLLDRPRLTVRSGLFESDSKCNPRPVVFDSRLTILQCRSVPSGLIVFTTVDSKDPRFQQAISHLSGSNGVLLSVRSNICGR